jgi:hypothetical protein
MQNEPNKSIEQRIAALEQSIAALSKFSLDVTDLMASLIAKANAAQADSASVANDSREVFKVIIPILEIDDDSKARALTRIRKAESHSDQREAGLIAEDEKINRIRNHLQPPQDPPPAS